MRMKTTLLTLCALALSACASLPDVKVSYYLPTTTVSIKVIRTVACDSKQTPIILDSADAVVVHTADPKQGQEFPISKLKGSLSDAEVKLDFYDDGRLKGVNASSTGEAEGILKTAISIAQLATLAFKAQVLKDSNEALCKVVKDLSPDKPLTLVYTGQLELGASASVGQPLKAERYPQEMIARLGTVCAFVTERRDGAPPLTSASGGTSGGDFGLVVRQPGSATIKVMRAGVDCAGGEEIWHGDVTVAQFGKCYMLPIPGEKLFGKQVSGATFAESGALTSLQFASNNGFGQALNVVNAGLTAAKDRASLRAAQLQAEADVIAQQQRLAQCLADKECK